MSDQFTALDNDTSDSEMSNSDSLAAVLSSPPKHRRADAIHQKEPPACARKKARLDNPPKPHSGEPVSGADPNLHDVHWLGELRVASPGTVDDLNKSLTSPASAAKTPSTAQHSLKALQDEAHKNCLELQKKIDKGKGTEKNYPRHVRNYLEFWDRDQAQRAKDDLNYVKIPAHPIIGEKVSLFLQHEITRSKRNNRNQDSGGSLGAESIKQIISALQNYIVHHQHEPEYANCLETRIPLCSQAWVKGYETASCANQPTHLQEAHDLKAKGSSNDIYTSDELVKMSLWTLRAFGPAKTHVHLGLRDRAMLLISTTVAFRGDSTRLMMLSDLFYKLLPMGSIGDDVKLQALGILADQSKMNVSGKVEEHGLFRHRLPELCGFGAIGFYLFSLFHILEKRIDFAPDFTDPTCGEYGRQDWYKLYAFPGKGDQPDGMNPMSYYNHRDRVAAMHERNEVNVSAVTHNGRSYTVATARDNGAAAVDTKALGRWKTGDAYSEVYDCALPKYAMLAAAMFSTDNPTAYVLPRGFLVPPSELAEQLFPWAEAELAAYNRRLKDYGPKATDYALKNFLTLLLEFRVIILQDAAILFTKYPELNLWKYAPFNAPSFGLFARNSTSILEQAEISARQKLESLPKTVSTSMQGILQTLHIQQMQERNTFSQRFEFMEGLLLSQLTSTAKGRKAAEQMKVIPRSRSSSVGQALSRVPTNPETFRMNTPDVEHKKNSAVPTADHAATDSATIPESNALNSHFHLSLDEEE